MQKSVYSLVLMDDVVAAVDRLAYAAGTSRSNLINRILAEAAGMSTPQQQMQTIFAVVGKALEQQSMFQLLLSGSDAMFSVRSALQYKYNPSVKYALELYPHPAQCFGELRASLRTQNPALLVYLGQFYTLWAGLECATLNGAARQWELGSGRYTRRLQLPAGEVSPDQLGTTIAAYVSLLDACLKLFFQHLNDPTAASAAIRKLYHKRLDTLTAQL